jgi:hypothetical protein
MGWSANICTNCAVYTLISSYIIFYYLCCILHRGLCLDEESVMTTFVPFVSTRVEFPTATDVSERIFRWDVSIIFEG